MALPRPAPAESVTRCNITWYGVVYRTPPYDTMQRSLQVLFLVIVYVGSWLMWLFHCVRQLRMFQTVDFDNKTMKVGASIGKG